MRKLKHQPARDEESSAGNFRHGLRKTGFALGMNFFHPGGDQSRVKTRGIATEVVAQDVEVVHFTEKVLQTLDASGTWRIPAGQEILREVAEMFQADPSSMPGSATTALAGTRQESGSFVNVCQRQALEDDALQWEQAGLAFQLAGKLFPLLETETIQCFASNLALFLLPPRENSKQVHADGFLGRRQLPGPFTFYLRIAQRAEFPKEVSARFLNPAPSWIRIHLAQSFGHGAATAKSNTEVVHAFCIPGFARLPGSVDDALHPELEANTLVGGHWRNCNCLRHPNAIPEVGAEDTGYAQARDFARGSVENSGNERAADTDPSGVRTKRVGAAQDHANRGENRDVQDRVELFGHILALVQKQSYASVTQI